MFPDKEEEKLLEAIKSANGNIDEAVEQLLQHSDFPQSSPPPIVPVSSMEYGDVPLHDILTLHQEKVMNDYRVCEIEINRDQLWRQAMSFYKNSHHDSSRLKHQLHVEFMGEEGVDAGALRLEFFKCLLKEVDARLFQG